MAADNTGDQDKRMFGQQRVSEGLLIGTDGTGLKPVGIRNGRFLDNIDRCRIDFHFQQSMRHCVQHIEPLVDSHLEDRGGRIERRVDHTSSLRGPTAANLKGAFCCIPRGQVLFALQSPGDETAAAQSSRQRRQA